MGKNGRSLIFVCSSFPIWVVLFLFLISLSFSSFKWPKNWSVPLFILHESKNAHHKEPRSRTTAELNMHRNIHLTFPSFPGGLLVSGIPRILSFQFFTQVANRIRMWDRIFCLLRVWQRWQWKVHLFPRYWRGKGSSGANIIYWLDKWTLNKWKLTGDLHFKQ